MKMIGLSADIIRVLLNKLFKLRCCTIMCSSELGASSLVAFR